MAEQEHKAGEYVVTGSELTLKTQARTGSQRARYQQHKRGSVVKLTAEQAQMYAGGTRPIVAPKPQDQQGESAAAAQQQTTPTGAQSEGGGQQTKEEKEK